MNSTAANLIHPANDAGAVWWGQIGNSLRLLSKIADVQRDGKSAVLRVPAKFPWRDYFDNQIDLRRESFSADRGLKRLAWPDPPECTPDFYILKKLCPPNVQADYWPGVKIAQYLGARDDLSLCDYDIYITGVHTEQVLSQWIEFVTLYAAAAHEKELDHHAAFIIEYDGPDLSSGYPGIPIAAPPRFLPEWLDCRVEDYDCRVFCLELASGQVQSKTQSRIQAQTETQPESQIESRLESPALRGYLAELAASVGGNYPEFCAALCDTGDLLLSNPVAAVKQTIAQCRDSAGNAFPDMRESEISSAVWRAMIVQLFPLLERCRLSIISKYQKEIAGYLPIDNGNGERIDEPFDLEISSLHFLITRAAFSVLPSELETVRLCRKIRNALAHNRLADFDDVKWLLTL